MAFAFGDTFDLYATMADAFLGYWDSGANPGSLQAGRFSGSQAMRWSSSAGSLTKSSGSNDAMHHIVCAFRNTGALSGTTANLYLQLLDGTTAQCSIVFRSDGAILLTSGAANGTTLATYSGAVSATNTWFAFEFEVIISNTVGRFRVRKNGNTADDFDSGATLNTRPGANSYANKLTIAIQTTPSGNNDLDDLLWRSDASSVPFVGDIRGYARLPASDVSTQWARAPASVVITPQTSATTIAIGAGTARYTAFTATYDGTVGSVTISLGVGYTGNLKCSMFANAAGLATSVLGSATTLVNPIAGANTFTFPTPVAVTRGVTYWIGFDSDTSSGTYSATAGNVGLQSTTAYAAFPVASPAASGGQAMIISVALTLTASYMLVNEPQQDGTSTYVYDATVNDADLYAIASIGGVPSNVVAVTTRGFFSKSDAGARGAQVQLKSGATTVGSTPTLLSNSFGWLYRTDTVDPATGIAWTGAAVDALQIGPVVNA